MAADQQTSPHTTHGGNDESHRQGSLWCSFHLNAKRNQARSPKNEWSYTTTRMPGRSSRILAISAP